MHSNRVSKFLVFRISLLLLSVCCCINATSAMTTHPDIPYATLATQPLLLDLYLPDNTSNPPLILWLHGGVWRFGSKANPEIIGIVEQGFALASVDFRNSPQARFPAQIHDIKAAIRFLRANAADYGFDPDKIVLWGYSSGGHLAALTGVSNGNAVLEGTLGQYRQVSSDVQAIIDFSGPTNLHTILHQSTPHGVSVRAPGMQDLLGKAVEDPAVQDMVDLASPVLQVSDNSPPLLLMHGLQDNQVPVNQALELQAAYQARGRHVEVRWIPQGQHGSGEYFRSPYIEQVADFLRRML